VGFSIWVHQLPNREPHFKAIPCRFKNSPKSDPDPVRIWPAPLNGRADNEVFKCQGTAFSFNGFDEFSDFLSTCADPKSDDFELRSSGFSGLLQNASLFSGSAFRVLRSVRQRDPQQAGRPLHNKFVAQAEVEAAPCAIPAALQM